MDDASFIRYLAAKRSVDDRALNRRVWDAMLTAARRPFASGQGPRVLKLGGGIGTMVDRVAEERRLLPASWTMIDEQPALIAKARERFAHKAFFPLELLAMSLDAYLA